MNFFLFFCFFPHPYRAICSQLNLTLQLEENGSVSSTCFLSTRQRIAVYSACSLTAIFFCFARAVMFYFVCVNASRVLHNKMFASVLRTPVRFFDTNPIGKWLDTVVFSGIRFNVDWEISTFYTCSTTYIHFSLLSLGIKVRLCVNLHY